MLSTYYETVFIKAVENERNKFRISNPIETDKLLKCTYYILSKAFESKHIHTNSNFIQILHENYDENVNENYDIPKNKSKYSANQEDDYNQNDSAYSSTSSLLKMKLNGDFVKEELDKFLEQKRLVSLRKEIQKAIFINEGIVGSGRFGNVLKIKISSNPNYLAFKHQDIFRDKDKRNELKNEIKVYQLLQTLGLGLNF
jgi:hypothetical protein